MPVLAKFNGIVIRLLLDRTFGIHLHAFYGDSEMVVGLSPVRILQSDVPSWVETWVLDWIRRREHGLQSFRSRHLHYVVPPPRQSVQTCA